MNRCELISHFSDEKFALKATINNLNLIKTINNLNKSSFFGLETSSVRLTEAIRKRTNKKQPKLAKFFGSTYFYE